jgi:hypothetical protein
MSEPIVTFYGKVRVAVLNLRSEPTYKKTTSRMDNDLHNQITDLHALITDCLEDHDIESEQAEEIASALAARLPGAIKLTDMKERLAILFHYERSYLELVKEFKEEIKFAGSIQEDLRKERAKFFADTLKEVASTLKDSQVEPAVAATWIKDLVGSYTKSLDLSSGLIEEKTVETIGKIHDNARAVAQAVEANRS